MGAIIASMTTCKRRPGRNALRVGGLHPFWHRGRGVVQVPHALGSSGARVAAGARKGQTAVRGDLRDVVLEDMRYDTQDGVPDDIRGDIISRFKSQPPRLALPVATDQASRGESPHERWQRACRGALSGMSVCHSIKKC
jgi:hypothetical protein